MKLPHRRNFLRLAAGAVTLPAASRAAWAQSYPSRPVRWIVGFAPGGGNDIVARLMGPWLSERLGQPVVIENRPGAATNIATETVVRAPPDGYTLFFASTSSAINATLYEKLNFNFIRDIAPVAGIIRIPNVMVVNPSIPARSVPEFIAYTKSNAGKVNMASPGVGTSIHLSGELFKLMTGIDMVHVPYKGSGPALTDLLGGQVQVMFGTMPSLIEYIGAGRLARAGGDDCDALGGATGHSKRERVCTRLRGEHVVRHERANGHACRGHRQAQQRDQCGPC